ncbi:MAG: glycosyltransferase family 2 protein [Candidatus Falkowbacteria bacterium]|nr:MAG: glycosyltransferase family 2 protein [Candidatus Falkowbacteria bacterium]
MKKICIIPAYNEAKNISEVIKRVNPFVDEIVVIDDGSQDEIAIIAQQAGATVLRHSINRGQGAALQTGNEYALKRGADIVIHFDADNQFQAEEIPELTAPIESGQAEAVLGSRFLSKKSDLPALKKKLIMPLARLINRWFFNIRLSDPQSGFRVLSRGAVEKIEITNDRMAHCSEILHQLFKNKIKTVEVPITVVYHEFGQKFSGGVRIIKDLAIKKIIK